MFYVAIIEGDPETGYSVFFPDMPGCASEGNTIEQAAINAEDALRGHLALMIRDGDVIPEQRPIDAIGRDPEVNEVARVLVKAEVPSRSVRVNISMDDHLLEQVDRAAAARGQTRSGFIAEAARHAL
jgi:predicted RNase H-like HicB family nuclease